MAHDVLYDIVICLLFLVVQVSWVPCGGYQIIPRKGWPGCDIKHPLSSKAKVKEKLIYTSHCLLCLHGRLQG